MLLNTTQYLADTANQILHGLFCQGSQLLRCICLALRPQKLHLNLIKGRLLRDIPLLETTLPDEIATRTLWARADHTQVKAHAFLSVHEGPATKNAEGLALRGPAVQKVTYCHVVLSERLLSARFYTNPVILDIYVGFLSSTLLHHDLVLLPLQGVVVAIILDGGHTRQSKTVLLRSDNIHLVLLGKRLKSFGGQALRHGKKRGSIRSILESCFQFSVVVHDPLFHQPC